jgi:hypothetical protein
MKQTTYSQKLKDPRWQKKRLEILNRDEWKCRYCGDKKTTLAVHHLEYLGEPWEAPEDKLITLCEDCHHLAETDCFKHRQMEGIIISKSRHDEFNMILFMVKDAAKRLVFFRYDLHSNQITYSIGFTNSGVEDVINFYKS